MNEEKHNESEGSGPEFKCHFIRTIDRIFDFLNLRNLFAKGYKSPIFPKTHTTAPLKCVDEPEARMEVQDKTLSIKNIIRSTTTTLLNIIPDQRDRI